MLANHIFLGVIGAPQVIIIIAVALLFFGGKKIPELMRGLGGGIREFKDGQEPERGTEKRDIPSEAEIQQRSEELKRLQEKNS